MSNIIEFNAGEFKFDVSCKQGAGSRVFVTDFKGKNVQVFDLGDWQWTWSQITCDKQLDPDTVNCTCIRTLNTAWNSPWSRAVSSPRSAKRPRTVF